VERHGAPRLLLLLLLLLGVRAEVVLSICQAACNPYFQQQQQQQLQQHLPEMHLPALLQHRHQHCWQQQQLL
jgi:hypothetical protein